MKRQHARPMFAHPERVEVAGSRWDLALFVAGFLAILLVLAVVQP